MIKLPVMIRLPAFTLALFSLPLYAASLDEPLLNAGDAEQFCETLPAIDEDRLSRSFGGFYEYFKNNEGVDPAKIKPLSLEKAAEIIEPAIARGWDITRLVTDTTLLKGGPCAYIIDHETLLMIDDVYDLHALWMVRAPLGGGQTMEMDYLLFGDGKLIIGFPDRATIKVEDYDFSGGRYEYTPYLSADIINDGGQRGLDNLKVLTAPGSPPGHFKGPKTSSILDIWLEGTELTIRYQLLFKMNKHVSSIPMEKRGP